MLKKLLAFFEVVFVVFLVILIITIFTFFLSFSKENSLPTVFGHSFFILDTDDMQNDNGNGINKGALVIASDNELDSLKEGMVVLCDINDIETEEPDYDVLRIYGIEPGSETTKYTVSNEKMASNRTYIIEKDKIVAKCKYSSDLLGQIIAFSRTSQGILTLVIIPCVVLIALQVVHIVARAKRSKFEQVELETFEFPSDMTFPDDEQSPLYDPTKSDYSQKTDVEEFFANKNYKDTTKRRKKSDIVSEEKSKTEKKSEKSSDINKTDEKSPDESVSKKTKVVKTDSKEAKGAVVVATDSGEKSEEKTVLSQNKAEEKTDILPEIQKTPGADAPEIKEESTPVKADESKPAEQNLTVDEKLAEESVNLTPVDEPEEKPVSVKSEEASAEAVASSGTMEQVAEAKAETKTEAERPKKKTTVKKRAVVKKGPSASAADLLKAIDTESKKLK